MSMTYSCCCCRMTEDREKKTGQDSRHRRCLQHSEGPRTSSLSLSALGSVKSEKRLVEVAWVSLPRRWTVATLRYVRELLPAPTNHNDKANYSSTRNKEHVEFCSFEQTSFNNNETRKRLLRPLTSAVSTVNPRQEAGGCPQVTKTRSTEGVTTCGEQHCREQRRHFLNLFRANWHFWGRRGKTGNHRTRFCLRIARKRYSTQIEHNNVVWLLSVLEMSPEERLKSSTGKIDSILFRNRKREWNYFNFNGVAKLRPLQLNNCWTLRSLRSWVTKKC